MLNDLIEEQENLLLKNDILIRSQELKGHLNLSSVSDFIYGKLFGWSLDLQLLISKPFMIEQLAQKI